MDDFVGDVQFFFSMVRRFVVLQILVVFDFDALRFRQCFDSLAKRLLFDFLLKTENVARFAAAETFGLMFIKTF